MRRNPLVTLLCYDPREPLRSLEVRGTIVEMTEEGARDHLDALASKYAGRPIRYFGDAIPARFAETEVPVLCRIRPRTSWRSTPRRRRHGDDLRSARAAGHPGRSPRPAHSTDLRRLHDNGPGRAAQSSLVWVDFDGECPRVNTTLERQKGRNIRANPKVSLLVVDPDDTARFIQLRGEAELVADGAVEHLDALTRAYTRHPQYYGFIYPLERKSLETRVICRIHARRISLDAIHA